MSRRQIPVKVRIAKDGNLSRAVDMNPVTCIEVMATISEGPGHMVGREVDVIVPLNVMQTMVEHYLRFNEL